MVPEASAASPDPAPSATAPTPPAPDPAAASTGSAAPAPSITCTAEFCASMREAADTPLPPRVACAARRTLFNVLGAAIGAAGSSAAAALIAAAREQPGNGAVPVPGRAETLDPYWGALVAGTAAHLDDFDDTHLATVIHPGAAALAAVLALAPETGVSGARFLSAFAVGCEAQLRIGNAISPDHYDRGWHITGTCGVLGAAVASSILLDLDPPGIAQALSLASTMTLGHRDAFGSMTKAFHAGKAAANALLAAKLAAATVPPSSAGLGTPVSPSSSSTPRQRGRGPYTGSDRWADGSARRDRAARRHPAGRPWNRGDPMITTDEIVRLVLEADEFGIDQAEAELALFGQAITRGVDSEMVTVLRHVAPRSSDPPRSDPRRTGQPPGGSWPADPRWAAWLQGAAAAAGSTGPAWIAVCSAAVAAGAFAIDNPSGSVARAVAVGYLVADRVADGLPGAASAGWHVTAVVGTIGAGAAAGSLLGLTADQLRHAVGICATQAAGLGAACGTDAGPVQIGKAAFNAVEAALLARSGFTSSWRSLEGRRGLYTVFSGQPVKG